MAVTVVRREAARRWLVVGASALVLVSAPAAVSALPAKVPDTAVATLAARIRASAAQPFQGYAVSTGSAGLPALPQLGTVADLLNGDTRLRVWYAGTDRFRVDVIDDGTERDTYRLGGRELVWDYGRGEVTEVTGAPPVRLPRGADLVPPDLARRLLSMTDPGDRLRPLPARRIAGIAAAGLRIEPVSTHSTVGHVDVWADPRTGLPLSVSVTGKHATQPILVSTFLDVSLRAPTPSVLTPPAARDGIGYVVTDSTDVSQVLADRRVGPLPDELAGQPRTSTPPADLAGIGAYGTGLAQFVVLPVPPGIGFDAMRRAARAGGAQLDFPDGEGVLIATPLVSVLAMDADPVHRTYLLAGLVDPALLKQAGAELSSFGSVR